MAKTTIRLLTPDHPPTSSPFVENDPMPKVTLSTDTNLTFTWRGLTVPTVEALCAELAVRRAAGEKLNSGDIPFDHKEFYYARPLVLITGLVDVVDKRGNVINVDESVLCKFPWDHTVWSLLEAAETARAHRGAVYVTQDVHTAAFGGEDADELADDGGLYVDDGMEVMVADFVPAPLRAGGPAAREYIREQVALANAEAEEDELAEDEDEDEEGEE
jgi:hypothetical protein